MTDITLICDNCGKEFNRRKSEFNRNQKLGRATYCSLKCSGKRNIRNIPPEKANRDTSKIGGKGTDRYSPFRRHLSSAKRRNKDFDLTLEYLEELWNYQNGRCPYTGWKLRNQESTNHRLDRTPDRASLDRIDSSKGYVKGNVQFVSFMAQCAKHEFTSKQLVEFCESVVSFQ